MRWVLKPAGSFFLHCDWHADVYIRAVILDRIFGERNFRNHIVWKINFTKKRVSIQNDLSLAQNTDSISFIVKQIIII
jgi:site-specific DNA-methyltransferase (adenine-specific)